MTTTGEPFYIIPCENEYGNEHAAAVTPGGIQSGDRIVIFEIDGELFGYKPSGVVAQEMMYLNFAGSVGGGWVPQTPDEVYVGDTIIVVPVEGNKEDLIAMIDIPNFYSISGSTFGLADGVIYISSSGSNYVCVGSSSFNIADCSGSMGVVSEEFRYEKPGGGYGRYYGAGHNVVGFGCVVPVPIHGIQFEYCGTGVNNVGTYLAMCAFESSPQTYLSLDGAWHTVRIGPYPSRYALAPSTHNVEPRWNNPFFAGGPLEQKTPAEGRYTFWIYMEIPAPSNPNQNGSASMVLRNIKTVRY